MSFLPNFIHRVLKSMHHAHHKSLWKTIHHLSYYGTTLQKQPSADVFQNRCSYEFRSIHRRPSVLESLFNKVVELKDCNFLKKRLKHSCFPVHIAKFLRTAFFTEHRWLLLYFRHYSTRKHSQKKQKET